MMLGRDVFWFFSLPDVGCVSEENLYFNYSEPKLLRIFYYFTKISSLCGLLD